MKIQWEPLDLSKWTGQVLVSREPSGNFRYMLVWFTNNDEKAGRICDTHYGLIDLRDGMFFNPSTPQGIAALLTEWSARPEIWLEEK